MKIIILGAGQVGASVAENLASEANDITVVDTSEDSLASLRDRLEIRTVCGNAASPAVLRKAGADDADLLIALTQSDQVNLCACRIAKALFNLPTRIARLRSTDYEAHPELLDESNFAVDFSLCPEQVITDYIERLITFPEALQVLEFAHGVLSLICVNAFEGGPLVGHPLQALKFHLPNVEVRIAAIYRNGVPIIPRGDTVILAGDEIFCLAASVHIRQVMRELRRSDKPMRRIMIVGGGNIGLRLARKIEANYKVKLIEYGAQRAELLATELTATLVLRGDGTDETLLQSEGIDETDMFIAVSNDEEDNIMAASIAKRMGARRTLALINRRSYVDLVQGGPIDIAISPANTSIGALLAHVRRGDVVAVHSLRRGAAEALEIIAHGSRRDSKVVGRQIQEIPFPKGATIGAIVREIRNEEGRLLRREVIMPHHDTVVEENDHVIVFCTHKNLVGKVEKVFQVGFQFF
ncbi:MAG: Trk system potassium transporter TrkA [Thauera sp.]|nr:Trk system potassium transporter TrkA [Thauera sp.]